MKKSKPSRNARRKSGRPTLLMVSARASEAKRERWFRTGALVLGALILTVGIWGLVEGTRLLGRQIFSANDYFAIRHMDLHSDGKLQPDHIREYAGLERGMNLFAVDLRRIRRDLESVSIVQHVEIERRLPDTLAIRVSERVPLARLGRDARRFHLAVDRDGSVMGPSSRSPSLPAITGVRTVGLRPGSRLNEPRVIDALTVLDLCDRTRLNQFLKVESIDVSREEVMVLTLENGEQAYLPRERIKPKLIELASVLNAARNRPLRRIDLTVDNGVPAVEYR
jgi:cell division septal protein FtsQ